MLFLVTEDLDIIKIIEVKSKDRIHLPQDVRDKLKLKKGDHIAFLEDTPGVRVVKVKLDLEGVE